MSGPGARWLHRIARPLVASFGPQAVSRSVTTLFEAHPNGIEFDDAVEQLALVFADNANDSDYELDDDHPLAARRELRHWLKRGLIVERNARVLATDALQRRSRSLIGATSIRGACNSLREQGKRSDICIRS